MKGTNSNWWRPTAVHMWRCFYNTSDAPAFSESDTFIRTVCQVTLDQDFPARLDKDLLKAYFTSRWGDDVNTVHRYADQHGIPVDTAWTVIKRANLAVIERLGLIDKKEARAYASVKP